MFYWNCWILMFSHRDLSADSRYKLLSGERKPFWASRSILKNIFKWKRTFGPWTRAHLVIGLKSVRVDMYNELASRVFDRHMTRNWAAASTSPDMRRHWRAPLWTHPTAVAGLRGAFEPIVPAAGPESVTEQRVQRTYLNYPAKRDVTSLTCIHMYCGSLGLHAVEKYAHLLAVDPG